MWIYGNWLLENGCSCTRNVAISKWICRNYLILFHLNSNDIKVSTQNFSRFLIKLSWHHQQWKTYLNTSISLDLDNKSHSCETLNKGSTRSLQTDDPKDFLKDLRLKNVNRLICAQLNINSEKENKFDLLVDIVNNNIDILMIWEKNSIHLFLLDSLTFMGFLSLKGLIEMVTVVGQLCIFVKIYL